MEEVSELGFLDYFSGIDDPRIDRKKLYSVEELLLVTLCGVICGCEGWEDLEEFGETKLDFLEIIYLLSTEPQVTIHTEDFLGL